MGKNENSRQGAGYARNLGLKRAKGKWLIFADADDFFMPCFNNVLDKFKDNENDIIYFKVTSVDSETLQPGTRHEYITNILDNIQKTNNYDTLFALSTPWGKFIKRNIIETNQIKFQEIPYGNDVFFSVKSLLCISSKIITNDIIYCATHRTDSLVRNETLSSAKVRFIAECNANELLKPYKIPTRKLWLYMCWLRIYSIKKRAAVPCFFRLLQLCGIKFVFYQFYIIFRNYSRKGGK